jgi:hypothetical protein
MNPDALEFEIRDEHLNPLRLFLMEDPNGLDPFDSDPDDPSVRAERWLFAMAVPVAVRRRFGDRYTREQIIRFVADLRISMGEHANEVSPRVAEELIRMALNDISPDDVYLTNRDPQLDLMASITILEQLRVENVINDNEMDEFLQQTKEYAQQMLETQRALAAGDAHL